MRNGSQLCNQTRPLNAKHRQHMDNMATSFHFHISSEFNRNKRPAWLTIQEAILESVKKDDNRNSQKGHWEVAKLR